MVQSVVNADVPAARFSECRRRDRPVPEAITHETRIDHASETNRPDTRALRHIGLDAVMGRHQLEELALHTDVITVSRGAVLGKPGVSPGSSSP